MTLTDALIIAFVYPLHIGGQVVRQAHLMVRAEAAQFLAREVQAAADDQRAPTPPVPPGDGSASREATAAEYIGGQTAAEYRRWQAATLRKFDGSALQYLTVHVWGAHDYTAVDIASVAAALQAEGYKIVKDNQ